MGVKLRVRVVGVPGPARSLEVPETCTLGQLRVALVSKVLHDLWDGDEILQENVIVSLNGDEELGAGLGSPESSTLRQCGVTRGDLIHVRRRNGDTSGVAASTTQNQTNATPVTDGEIRRNALEAAEARNLPSSSSAPPNPNPTPMDTAEDSTEDAADATAARNASTSLPDALKQVLSYEQQSATNAKQAPLTGCELLFLTAHAALLDCGLVPVVDTNCTNNNLTLTLPDTWRGSAKSTGAIRVKYGLRGTAVATCEVKAQPMGDGVVVAAVAAGAKTHVLTLSCAGHLFNESDGSGDLNRNTGKFRFKDIRALWSSVKDEFAQQALLDVRTLAGLGPFQFQLDSLPDALKVGVLGHLEKFTDLVSVGGTCRSLRWIARADVLWERQVARTFPETYMEASSDKDTRGIFFEAKKQKGEYTTDEYGDEKKWRLKFKLELVSERERKRVELERAEEEAEARAMGPRRLFGPNGTFYGGSGYDHIAPPPRGFTPGITGGDYDLYPGSFTGPGMPGFPGSGNGGLGGGMGRGGFPGMPGGYYPPNPQGGWPVLNGGMHRGVPTPTPGVGLGGGRRGGRVGGRGRGFPGMPHPGWDGRPRPPGGPDGNFL
jgi:hypothetical protein